jgi:hypothetical protein
MTRRYDLHSHSTASDGTLAPGELVERAAAAGVNVLALTDHDTVEGIAEAGAAARRCGIELVAGVEVSVTWGAGTIHVLGLGVNPSAPVLQAGLANLREFRDWRAREIGRRLERDAGLSGAFEGALALSNGRLVSRTHFARFIVAQGRAESVRDVFRHYLKAGKPGHVPGQWAALGDAVAWIRAAGGQAVIAHPARYPLTRNKLRRLLGEFIEAGGVGLEVVSGSHSADDQAVMGVHARDFDLLASAGSDYHGPEQCWLELGRLPALPVGCRPIWDSWRAAA